MLPAPNSDWPPAPYDTVFKDIEKWDKQWRGTGEDFSNWVPAKQRGRIRKAWDAFVGKRNDPDRQPIQMHVPVAADIYRLVGSLMFAEGVKFTTGAGSEEDTDDEALADNTEQQDPVQDAADALVNTEGMGSLLQIAAESGSALGGYCLRVVWDKELNPFAPWIDRVDADHAIPEVRWGQLVAITFWSEAKEDDTVWRHFQEYGRGFVRHALFKGNATNVGTQEPLEAHTMTKGLVSTYDLEGNQLTVGVDEESRIATGASDLIAAVYVPNRVPNPHWRNEDAIRDFGMSDTPVDVLDLLGIIDELWSSLMRDVEQGKGRLVIPENLLELRAGGKGTAFNPDREFFTPIGEAIDEQTGKPIIEQIQFEIRVSDHIEAIKAVLTEVLRRVGISPLSFGLVDAVATTATEVRAWTRDTMQTVQSKRRLCGPQLCHIATALLTVYAEQWGKPECLPTEPLDVEWPEIVPDSPKEVGETVQMLFNAQSGSIETRVRRMNPGWGDLRVKQEVERIKEEFMIGKENQPEPPAGLFGEAPNSDEDAPDPDETADEKASDA